MTPEQVSVVIAVVSAVVAIVATVLGIVERRRTFLAQQAELKRQAEHWQREFASEGRRQEVALRTQFHLEQYRHRLSSYSAVMRTLGAVISVGVEAAPDRHEVLPQSKELLQSTADALYEHLYSEAGLLMTLGTRDRLHSARLACLHSLQENGSNEAADDLIDAFYIARRYLRADLELLDDRSPENLEKLTNRLFEEAKEVADRS